MFENEITETHLDELKERLHITHRSEDERLKRMIRESHLDVQSKTGPFDLDEYTRGRELVYERCRYSYNDAVEYFDDNFTSQLLSVGLELYETSVLEEVAPGETSL